MKVIDRIALALIIIGGLNWGSIGIFGLDMVAALFGGSASFLSRLVYILVCLSAIWCITLFFRDAPAHAPTRGCLLYTSPSPRDKRQSRMASSA